MNISIFVTEPMFDFHDFCFIQFMISFLAKSFYRRGVRGEKGGVERERHQNVRGGERNE